jgi:hypothetical protein
MCLTGSRDKSGMMESKVVRVRLALYSVLYLYQHEKPVRNRAVETLMKGILEVANSLLQMKGNCTAFVFPSPGSCIWIIRLSAILSEIAVERNVGSIPFISGIWPVSDPHRPDIL